MENGVVGVRDFNQFANFVRHQMFFYDRNRQGVYRGITNSDYASRREIWFPPTFNLSEFEGLPSDAGHNLYEKPADNRKADAWVLKIPGTRKGIKNQEDANVTIFPAVEEWCAKYQDLCRILLGEDLGKVY